MKRLKSVQLHPEVKNSWTKEGMIHALVQNGKIVKITEGNLKIIDEAATGKAPVLDRCRKSSHHPTTQRGGPVYSSSRPAMPA